MKSTKYLVTAALWILCAMLVCTAISGCERKSDENEEPAEGEGASKDKALPEAYTGELSHERFEGVAEMVTPFDAWEEGLAKIEAQLGKVTLVDEEKHYWAYADDEKCTYFYVTKDDEGEYQGEKGKAIVGTIASPSTVSLNEPFHVWSECYGWAGKEIPVDPDAPLPPEDGSTVDVKYVIAGVAGAPSKWIDQEVTVNGVLNSTSRTKQKGKVVTVIVSVGHSPEELMETVGCRLKDIESVPTNDVMQKTPVQAKGIVDPMLGGTLDECVLTVLEGELAGNGAAEEAGGSGDDPESDGE